jgi:hypothetical protein
MIELLIRLLIELLKPKTAREQMNLGLAPPPNARLQPQPIDPRLLPKLVAQLDGIEKEARRELNKIAVEAANQRFSPTVERAILAVIKNARGQIAAQGVGAVPSLWKIAERLRALLNLVLEMTAQRRDSDRLLLLGDADALADACLQPIVDFAKGEGIKLAIDRAATFLGDKDLGIYLGLAPTRLAPVVLPAAWAREVGWWPALAHEMGHAFFSSVSGLAVEVRQGLNLPSRPRARPGSMTVNLSDVDGAYDAWLDEIFADAFGTLMLGPAYVATMMWSFARPSEPAQTLVIAPAQSGYEEHPPGHLRVVLACRLLSEIGFPTDGDRLEAEWRKLHREPDRLYLQTLGGGWLAIDEESFLERGTAITTAIYEESWSALAGIPLRSIPGLDLGPREHQSALEVRRALLDGEPATTRDPRILIAGAVLAWREKPLLATKILRAARATIPSVGVGRGQLRKRAERDAGAAGPGVLGVSIEDFRDAVLMSAVMAPPPGRRRI